MDSRAGSSPTRMPTFEPVAKASLRKERADSIDVTRTESLDDTGGSRGIIRDSIDKLKPRSASTDIGRRGSNESNTHRRLSKLVPSRSRSKKLKKKTTASSAGVDSEDPRSSSVSDQGSPVRRPLDGETVPTFLSSTDHPSVESFGAGKSVGSSLLTSDSDIEDSQNARPLLAHRPSHAAYLTLSSPLVTAESTQPSISSDRNVQQTPELSPVASAPIAVPGHAEQVALDEQSTVANTLNYTAASAPSSVHKVSTSPGAIGGESGFLKSAPTLLVEGAQLDDSLNDSVGASAMAIKPDAPSTFITPPTPELSQSSSPKQDSTSKLSKTSTPPQARPLSASSSRSTSPQSFPTAQHRRAKSNTAVASKLSTSSVPPLTPTVEEAKSPEGTLTQPSSSPGFFSSMFSATQNAVTQLSNSFVSNPSGQRSRSGTSSTEAEKTGPAGGEEVIIPNLADGEAIDVEDKVEKEPAVATLGSGDLSLSHLGIAEDTVEPGATPSNNLTKSPSIVQDSRDYRPSEEVSAAEAVSAAYADKATTDKTASTVKDTSSVTGKSRSVASGGSATGDITPPRETSGSFDAPGTRRTDSVRSRLSDRKNRRRLSGMATGGGGAIAAAIGASHSTLAHPISRAATQRPPGVAVANSKRNKDFHQLFRSVPEDDLLIEDYSAALQRDILLHGRLYISDRHICFSSNILGWVTNLVMNFDEVVSTEKKSTAVIFPNAIVIQTLHAKNVFASFLNRDATYDLLISIWRTRHPNLKITENGHTLDNSAPSEKFGPAESLDEEIRSGDESDDFSEDGEDDADAVAEDAGDAASSAGGSETGDTTRAISQRVPTSGGPGPPNGNASKPTANGDMSPPGGTPAPVDFPGPATHPPTECSDQDTHYDKQIQDTVIPAPLGKIYSIMFGPMSGVAMRKFLLDDQKSTDLQMEDDKKGMGEDAKSFSYSFIKPLSGSIGPKQTKCIVSQTLDAFDLEKAVSVTCSTQTPDVPNGNIFVTKTKYCLMWASGNSTRLVMSSTVEWSGKSWLKGPIEKGASDGQTQYGKDLAAFLRSQVATKSPSKTPKDKVKSKKRRANGSSTSATVATNKSSSKAENNKSENWGPLEPLRSVLGPLQDILGPVATIQNLLTIFLGISCVVLATKYFRSPTQSLHTNSKLGNSQGLLSRESMLAQEQNELWTWLENRISLDEELPRLKRSTPNQHKAFGQQPDATIQDQDMTERQLDEAIRITQERLEALRDSVERKKKLRQEQK